VLELQRALAASVGCYARPEALDSLAAGASLAIRVAPDELLLLVDPDDQSQLLASAEQALAPVDGLALDLSGGFAVWRLRGDWPEALARLCAVAAPESPACVQALFAHVPAKLLFTGDELLVVVASVLSHHVHDRILAGCRDLDPHELAAAPLTARIAGAAA
jgi:heterotetrameric sarcosine oxidase gamma subunit